ncbi:PmoA family protein [Actinoplanes sp. KI2]|uniref:DUF6807 domain-containing protein n=1 Tax=Actinoplanes sp. KI2 TaxID=2983315 RepID=UPI0021D57F7D|nr:PmoA family protein [Actinoplanes sp. KI2]MCU7727419.1 PmoA family protein [Actinoplanes sp. KI2]
MTTLRVAGKAVATYVESPSLDIRLAPRPYLHPVRTLTGVAVTDALCYDHPWHLGTSVTMADVAGRNFWGGRTFVRDRGYVWLDDHGRIVHTSSSPVDDGFTARLDWCTADGEVVLREQRTVTATAAPHGWRLSFAYALSAPGDAPVTLGSPATHGRPGQAGYGGFFWRATPGPAKAFGATTDAPHGTADRWLAVTVADRYTLVFEGLAGADRWFVRTEEYVGVCAALAFDEVLAIEPGAPLARTVSVLVADGVLTGSQIEDARRSDLRSTGLARPAA